MLQKRKLNSVPLNALNVLMINPQLGNFQSPGSSGNDPLSAGIGTRFILTAIPNIQHKHISKKSVDDKVLSQYRLRDASREIGISQ